MADLEDRRPDARQRHQIALHFREHRLGQHRRPGREIVRCEWSFRPCRPSLWFVENLAIVLRRQAVDDR